MPVPLVHSQYMDFVLSGTAVGRTAVDIPGLPIVILWLGNGVISINLDSTAMYVN